MSHELAEWVALSLVPGLGSRTLDALLAHFGTLPAVLAAEDAALQAVSGIGPRLAAAIRAVDVDRTRDEIAAWGADTPDPFGRIDIVPRYDLRYPPTLRDLPDAPPVLFARGLIEAAHTPHAVAIVGTRQPHLVSRRIAAVLAQTLAAQGWAVISGLAAGIDGAAHRGTLGIGPTVAVLGCGVRMIYPPEHESLAENIMDGGGVLLSEVHPDAAPHTPALVARNRIISGLAQAVVVVEAGPTGGSYHTVRFAQAQGRRVYAVANESHTRAQRGSEVLFAAGAVSLPMDGASAAARLLADY